MSTLPREGKLLSGGLVVLITMTTSVASFLMIFFSQFSSPNLKEAARTGALSRRWEIPVVGFWKI
jgi:hypothetical protein